MDEITRTGLRDYLIDIKGSIMKTKYHLDRAEELTENMPNYEMVSKMNDMIMSLNELIDNLWEDEIDG